MVKVSPLTAQVVRLHYNEWYSDMVKMGTVACKLVS